MRIRNSVKAPLSPTWTHVIISVGLVTGWWVVRRRHTMSLLDQLNADLKSAMLARDNVRKNAIRSAKTAILNAQVEKRGRLGADATLDEDEILAVIARQAKQRRDSIVEFKKAGREDLVAQEEAELAVLQAYLPSQLSREEIVEVVSAIIADVGATSPRQIGLVMRPAMAQLRGRADGKLVNEVVRQLLSGSS